MAPAGGGRLVRLANLWRLPFQHLHAELEVPHLIRYPFRRAAADDDRFRVVREAHHDQRVPGAQRRARARVLDLRSGGQWVSRYHLQLAAGERVGSAERYLLPSERFWGALLEAETNSSPQSAPEAAAWRGTRGRRRRKKSRSGPRRSSNRAGHTALTSIVSHSRFPTSTGMAGPPLPLPHLFSRAPTCACRGYTPLGTRGQSDPPSRASNPFRACGPAIGNRSWCNSSDFRDNEFPDIFSVFGDAPDPISGRINVCCVP